MVKITVQVARISFFLILFNNEQHKHKAYNLLRALDDSLMPLQTASKSNHYQIY